MSSSIADKPSNSNCDATGAQGLDSIAPQGEPGSPAADYKVGYGKPPLNTRFKKGQSGNPSGRPAGRKSVRELIMQEAARTVFAYGTFDLEEMPAFQAILRGQCELALKGHGPAQRHFLKLVLQAEHKKMEADKERKKLEKEADRNVHLDLSHFEEALTKDYGPYWSGEREATLPNPSGTKDKKS
jgi:Family of unknown function (DUF5681)